MKLLVLQVGSDNLTYVLASGEGRACAVIDPIDAGGILEAVNKAGLGKVEVVFNTHGHGDHTSGNLALIERTGAKLLAHDPDRGNIPGKPGRIKDGETINVDGLDIKVLHTPGHTRGGVCLYVEPDGEVPRLFSGDTVFLSGCGNPRFGGDPEVLYETFRSRIFPLPVETMLHPGHDYAIHNLGFALSVEPDNEAAKKKLEDARGLKEKGGVPESTLAEERDYSPFFRLDSPPIRANIEKRFKKNFNDEKATFLALRELRNQW